MQALSGNDRRELENLVRRLRRGDGLMQADFDVLIQSWQAKAAPAEKEKAERFAVARPDGTETDVIGPRWAFHLFGLRHRAAHVALRTETGLILLQKRSPTKADWPDALDITVAGHIPREPGQPPASWEAGAWKEISEEIGLNEADANENFAEGCLVPIGEPYFSLDRDWKRDTPFINAEVRQIFAATLTGAALSRLQFSDNEVAGLLLIPLETAWDLLISENIASGLRYSLPRVLNHYEYEQISP